MGEKCGTCKTSFNDKDKLVTCDSCHATFHSTDGCTNLAPSEYRAVIIQNRSLIFFCKDCRVAFKKIPLLLRQIEELRSEVRELKDEVNILKNEKNTLEEKLIERENAEMKTNMEEIINEMEDRKMRSNNIMILNINESNAVNRNDRMEEEKRTVRKILAHASITINDFKVIRTGKYDGSKTRPVKVVLESNEAVVNILKNRKKINEKIPSIRIFADQTVIQREYYKQLRSKLNDMVNAGDTSKMIKYVNGIPKIVKKNDPKN